MTYRLLPETAENAFLVIESFSRITQPDRGLLGQACALRPGRYQDAQPAAHF